jgi:membrane-bound lytic murein transglycosylase MltF
MLIMCKCGKPRSRFAARFPSSRRNEPAIPIALLLFIFVFAPILPPGIAASAAQEPPSANRPQIGAEQALGAPFGLHTDDLDAMVQRRNIRALVMINPIGFFYDNGQPMGIMYEALSALETYVNQKFNTGALNIQVSFIPVRPDQAEAALTQGVGDFIAYSLVVTPQRQQQVAFTIPLETNAQQVLVTRPNFGTVTSVEDLGGKEIYANPLTIQYAVLQDVNDKLKKAGKALIVIKPADKYLLEDDLVEMVNAGLLPATVIEVSRAKLWAQVLHNLTVHSEPALASGEQTAWGLRKNNPELKQLLDEFIAPRAVGSSFGNTLVRRYLENTKWVVNSTSPQEMKKFEALSGLFKKYASQYDFDYLMMMAQGYQESRLEQGVRSPGGAVGIMQVMPQDAAANPINVPNVWTAEGNIHAGIKILRTIEDKYLNDPKLDPLNKTLLAFASYNAGPNQIAWLREQAPKQGLDPNQWFGNMELMVARNIGQVTPTYVGNVYKYYIAYKLALQAPGPRGRQHAN